MPSSQRAEGRKAYSKYRVPAVGSSVLVTTRIEANRKSEGELVDLIDEFSDGRIQFAFAKIKDPNTTLPKSVLIGWCGEGVPEQTKGYFTSHLAAVSKVLHVGGYLKGNDNRSLHLLGLPRSSHSSLRP